MSSFDQSRKRGEAAIASLEGVFSSFEELLQAQLDEISANDERIAESNKAAQNALDELETIKTRISAETKQLKAAVEPLRAEKTKLDEGIAKSIEKNSVLKTDNVRLEQENDRFRKYEGQAWKVLGAKESELQAREKTIREKEQLTPIDSSLLPPMI